MVIINMIPFVLGAINRSDSHIAYASWFSAPDLLSILIFSASALMVTINLMPLGKKN